MDIWRDFFAAYELAVKAEKIIPRDPKLAELFAKCSLKIDIQTEPAGAKVYFKEYRSPKSEWTYLGLTPIEKIRLPIGVFRWKIEKEGYETVLAAASTWEGDLQSNNLTGPNELVRVLDKKGSIPPDMLRIPGEETAVGKCQICLSTSLKSRTSRIRNSSMPVDTEIRSIGSTSSSRTGRS